MGRRIRSRKGAPGVVDVAAKAGVSPATVSRAFMTPDLVREATRKRILLAAETLGYVRERSAGAMRTRFSGTMGLVVPTIDNAIFAELAAAFSARLLELGRTMLIASHDYDLGRELDIVRSLVERRIDGVALIGFDHEDVPLSILHDRHVPVLALWNYDATSELPSIGADNRAAGRLIAEHVHALRLRDVAYLFPDTARNDRARDRLDGALAAAVSAGHAPDPRRVVVCPYDLAQAKMVAAHMLRDDPPDAFVCGNDIIAQGVVFACQAAGVDVPGRVSVLGIGDFRGSAEMEPGLTTVRLPARTIGRLGAETLVRMSETGAPPRPFHQEIATRLVVRASTRAA